MLSTFGWGVLSVFIRGNHLVKKWHQLGPSPRLGAVFVIEVLKVELLGGKQKLS